jgi:DcuC family C4-dicarboxylate transporter
MTMLAGVLIVAVAVYAMSRGVDVRLALLLAALLLGALSWQLAEIVRVFLATLASEQFVVPLCCAMGFAHVLRFTTCDQHLVQLLVRPLRRLHGVLIPGTVVVGYLVNIPVISQTSTAVVIGSVVIPLLRGAGISPVTSGAALLLGSSIGGELLNPGAPEINTIASITSQPSMVIAAKIAPLSLLHLTVATTVFWIISLRAERHYHQDPGQVPEDSKETPGPPLEVSWIKAIVPLVPLVLLFLTGPPLELLPVPRAWLVNPENPAEATHFNSRLVGAAMLLGVSVAALTTPSVWWGAVKVFFEGAGYAFTSIISLIVTAACFGKGIELLGMAAAIGSLIRVMPSMLVPVAGILPLLFAVLCGSGMASTQSLFKFFAEPAQHLSVDPAQVGAIVSLGAAAGRTMSPVAAVTLMCAALTRTNPVALIKRVALPLLGGVAAMVIMGCVIIAPATPPDPSVTRLSRFGLLALPGRLHGTEFAPSDGLRGSSLLGTDSHPGLWLPRVCRDRRLAKEGRPP